MAFLKSSKKKGRHESIIIKKLIPYFENEGFEAVPHARLNIAWGNILSDIDVLLVKGNKIGAIEVKSSHDNLKRAKKQIANIRDYVDFVYIATDYKPRKLPTPIAGWIHVKDKVTIMKQPKIISRTPSTFAIDSLPKKCLERFMLEKDLPYKGKTKTQLTDSILCKSEDTLRKEVQAIATCGQECDANCPIWKFGKFFIPNMLVR